MEIQESLISSNNNFSLGSLVHKQQLIHLLVKQSNLASNKTQSILFFPPLSANEPYTEKESAKYSQVNGYAKSWLSKDGKGVLNLDDYNFYSISPFYGNSYLEDRLKREVLTVKDISEVEQKTTTCEKSVTNVSDFIIKNKINVRAIAGASFGGSSLISALSTPFFKKGTLFKDISGGGVLDTFSKRFYLIQVLLQNPKLYYVKEPETFAHFDLIENLLNAHLNEIKTDSLETIILQRFFKDFFLKRYKETIFQFLNVKVFDSISEEARVRDDLLAIFAREFAFIGGYVNLAFYSKYVEAKSLSDYKINQKDLFSWFDPSPKDGTRAEQYIREMNPKALALLCLKNINTSFFIDKRGKISNPNNLELKDFAKNIKDNQYTYDLKAVELDSLFSASTTSYFIESLKKCEDFGSSIRLKIFSKEEVPLQTTHGHDTFLSSIDICEF